MPASAYPKVSSVAERASTAVLLHFVSLDRHLVLRRYSKFHGSRVPPHHGHCRVDKPKSHAYIHHAYQNGPMHVCGGGNNQFDVRSANTCESM